MKKQVVCLLILFILAACNKDQKAARAQLLQAESLYENAEYGSAKQVLDQLKENYPRELATQKEALQLMREIELAEQKRNIAFCDSMIVVRQAEAENRQKFFVFEQTEYDNQGRYIDKTYNPQPGYAAKYIKVHVDEDAEPVLSSVYQGSPIGHNRIKVSVPSGEYAETEVIPYDGGTNFSFKDINGVTYETVTYRKGKDQGVLPFISKYKEDKITLEYLGGKKTAPYVLSVKEKNAVANTLDLTAILKDIDQFVNEKEKAEKRLEYLQKKTSEVNDLSTGGNS